MFWCNRYATRRLQPAGKGRIKILVFGRPDEGRLKGQEIARQLKRCTGNRWTVYVEIGLAPEPLVQPALRGLDAFLSLLCMTGRIGHQKANKMDPGDRVAHRRAQKISSMSAGASGCIRQIPRRPEGQAAKDLTQTSGARLRCTGAIGRLGRSCGTSHQIYRLMEQPG